MFCSMCFQMPYSICQTFESRTHTLPLSLSLSLPPSIRPSPSPHPTLSCTESTSNIVIAPRSTYASTQSKYTEHPHQLLYACSNMYRMMI